MNNFYFWLGTIVVIIICLYGYRNKEKRLLISILLFLFGSLPWIIYGLIEIGMRASKDWPFIILVAIYTGGSVSLSASIAWWAQEKGIHIIPRFFRNLFQRKK